MQFLRNFLQIHLNVNDDSLWEEMFESGQRIDQSTKELGGFGVGC
jgi:hypothetical protein